MAQPVQPWTIHENLAVYRIGSGEPIFFMPGPHRFQRPGLRSADAIIAGLTALGRQVITYDPPGSGRSTRPANLGMEEMHLCTDEALEVCAVSDPIDAIGHSMGGLAMLAYALERPSLLKSLILVGTGAGRPSYMQAEGALWNRSHPGFYSFAFVSILHIIWPFKGPQLWMSNLIERYSFHDPSLARPQKVSIIDWFAPRTGRTDWHRIAVKLDYSSRLGDILIPTLVLCGCHDPQFPPACSQALAEGLAAARLLWFEHSGHYPFIEETEKFWTILDDFLKQ